MKALKLIGSWLWRLAAAGAGHAGGLMLGAFAFVLNGVGTALELSEFSTLGGGPFLALGNLPASFLCALIVVALFPAQSTSGAVRAFLARAPGRLAGSLLLAFLAFPFFYFLFGLMIAPIVLPYYEQIDFIVVPPLATILLLLCIRSALFLLVSMPVILCWGLSRGRLAFALAAGNFTAVGLSGLVQATFFPTVVRLTHGVEILATSICWGLALAWLLFDPPARPADGR